MRRTNLFVGDFAGSVETERKEWDESLPYLLD